MRFSPRLNPGIYVFSVRPPEDENVCIGWFREREGVTWIVPEAAHVFRDGDAAFRAAWITLDTPTDLRAVGITASVAAALARAGIPCNVMAAVHHDHFFVPAERGAEAVDVIAALPCRPQD